MRSRLRSLLPAALLLVAMLLSACGSSDDAASTPPTRPAGEQQMRVGVVADVGGLNDRGFNALADKGLRDAVARLGVDGRVLTSASTADYVPNLATLAGQGYDLVIGVGFLMTDAVDKVATKFPNTKFAIVDVPQSALAHRPPNVVGLVFKEQEAGYLAGYLAGRYAKDNGIDTVSSIGGQKIPPVDRYIAGYQAGAKAADPGITTLNGYSQDFADQAKCKEVALDQIGQGSKVLFAVASSCGLGALDAAKERGLQGIGVDADQGYLGSHVLTSATKKVDIAVLSAARAVQDGSFQGGHDVVFDVKSGGVGLGAVSDTGRRYQADVDKLAERIKAGSISIPETVRG
jgi:basic membrane protein A and related proteins